MFFAAFAFFYRVSLCSFFLHVFPAVVVLFLTMFVIFFWFGLSLLHAVSDADTFYYSLFLSTVFLHIRFNFYPFLQKDLGLYGPNNLYWIKRVLNPICLNLPNSFCRRFVFYGKSLYLAFLSQPRHKSILFFFFRLLFLFLFLFLFLEAKREKSHNLDLLYK